MMNRSIWSSAIAASIILAWTVPQAAFAQTQNPTDAFEETLIDLCFVNPPNLFELPPDQAAQIVNVCGTAFPGGALAAGGSAQIVTTTNLGNVGAQGRADYGQRRGSYLETIDERTQASAGRGTSGQAASGDVQHGNFGFFFSGSRADSDRDITLLENGYDEDSNTFLAGVDYRFSVGAAQMPVVVGLTGGRTSSDTRFSLAGGTQDAKTWTGIVFASVVPLDNASITAYVGRSTSDFSSARAVGFGAISGTATSTFDGHQTVAGIGGTYDHYVNNWSIGGFVNLDHASSETDGYTEAGTTGLELAYDKQSNRLLTLSAGMRVAYNWFRGWGSITPYAEGAYVHEYDDDARTISANLVLNSGSTVQFATDDPDRNYGRIGAGIIVELDHGPQVFLSYERQIGHSFLDVATFTGGARFQF